MLKTSHYQHTLDALCSSMCGKCGGLGEDGRDLSTRWICTHCKGSGFEPNTASNYRELSKHLATLAFKSVADVEKVVEQELVEKGSSIVGKYGAKAFWQGMLAGLVVSLILFNFLRLLF